MNLNKENKEQLKAMIKQRIEDLAERMARFQEKLNDLEYSEMSEGDYKFAAWYLAKRNWPMSIQQVNSYASKVAGWKIKPIYRGKRKVYTRQLLDEAIERKFAPLQEPKKYKYD